MAAPCLLCVGYVCVLLYKSVESRLVYYHFILFYFLQLFLEYLDVSFNKITTLDGLKVWKVFMVQAEGLEIVLDCARVMWEGT